MLNGRPVIASHGPCHADGFDALRGRRGNRDGDRRSNLISQGVALSHQLLAWIAWEFNIGPRQFDDLARICFDLRLGVATRVARGPLVDDLEQPADIDRIGGRHRGTHGDRFIPGQDVDAAVVGNEVAEVRDVRRQRNADGGQVTLAEINSGRSCAAIRLAAVVLKEIGTLDRIPQPRQWRRWRLFATAGSVEASAHATMTSAAMKMRRRVT